MEHNEERQSDEKGLGESARQYANLEANLLPNDARTEVRAHAEDVYQTAAVNATKAGMNEVAQMLRAEANEAGEAEAKKYDEENNRYILDSIRTVATADFEASEGAYPTRTVLPLTGNRGDENFEKKLTTLYSVLGVHDRRDVVAMPNPKAWEDRRIAYRGATHWDDFIRMADQVYEMDTNVGVTIREASGTVIEPGDKKGEPFKRGTDEWVILSAYRKPEPGKDVEPRIPLPPPPS